MSKPSIIVLGGTGLIGSAVCDQLRRNSHSVLALNSRNYNQHAGAAAEVLINCNGNSYRYKAAQDPAWDFAASVVSVEKSLFDFKCQRYFYISTVDVYDEVANPAQNHEEAAINQGRLHPYGFHRWLAERLVERFAKGALILRTGTVVGPAVKKGPLFDLANGGPLHMSLESELSLIDTATIAEIIAQFIATPPTHLIINLTGTGAAKLSALCETLGCSAILATGAEQIVHRYNINNSRLRNLFPVPTSNEIGSRFLTTVLNSKS